MSWRPLRVCGYALRAACLAFALASCATWQPPDRVDDATLRAGAITETKRDVRVSAALLDAQTSQAMFGPGIAEAGVQPVWFEVENRTPQPLWLLRTGTDPDYFSPLEVAWGMHKPLAKRTNAGIDEHIEGQAFRNPVPPGATHAGVIFTNLQSGRTLLNVDLFGRKTLVPFSLFVAAEGGPAAAVFQYPEGEVKNYSDLATLRAALEQLPCCASDAGGAGRGDPLNVVIIGTMTDIYAAGVRRNYRRDLRESDRAQRVFGRELDLVARKWAQAGAPATWIRLWVSPMRFEGKPVFVGQVGRPVGGRFATSDASNVVLHGDVDEARNLLIQDAMYSGGLEKLGFANGVGEVAEAAPRTVFNGARYHTDGLRAVLFFATRPLSLSDVEVLDWVPALERREADARERGSDGSD